MKYRVIHKTEYVYADDAAVCHNIAHLSPRSDGGQQCTSHYLSVVPQPTVLDERADHFGNRTFYFSIERPHRSMTVTATSTIQPAPGKKNMLSRAEWKSFADDLETLPMTEQLTPREMRLASVMAPHLAALIEYARPSFAAEPTIQGVANHLMGRIYSEFKYDPAFTTLATPLGDVLEHKRGVCQDFAHLTIACLRSQGLSARYMSGYLETLPPPGQEKLTGADASHAWVSVFLPDAGWMDIDPTNNQHPDERYLVLGWGRDYSDVPPLKGVIFGGGAHKLKVAVDVERMG